MRTLLLLIIFSFSLHASILPENNLAISLTDKNEGLSKAQYDDVINKVEAVYRPIVEALGKKLIIERLWEDPRVNAGTFKRGNDWVIRMYGGYARHPLVTEDAYALVMCHELGHHLGGAPKKVAYIWPSTEGQADYFATLKCLRKIFKNDNNIEIISKLEVSSYVRENCALPFKREWEKALCVRTTLAGMTTAAISAELRNHERPTPETPDESVVQDTYEAHPEPQCRLDTYFQGSICEVSSFISVSSENEMKGVCHQKNGHMNGTRPLCWFRPQD